MDIEETDDHPVTSYTRFFLDHMPPLEGADVLDFGCGSGVLSVAAAFDGARSVVGYDIDPRALELTEANARRNTVANLATHLIGRRAADAELAPASVDVVLCNPASLPTEHDAGQYWSGGPDGTSMISSMVEVAARALRPAGRLLYIQTSLASARRCWALLEEHEFAGRVTAVAPVPFRPFYEPLVPYFERLRAQGVISYTGSGVGDGREFLYLVDAARHGPT